MKISRNEEDNKEDIKLIEEENENNVKKEKEEEIKVESEKEKEEKIDQKEKNNDEIEDTLKIEGLNNNKNDNDSFSNFLRFSYSDKKIFHYLKDKNDESMKEIFKNNENEFSDINPLRIRSTSFKKEQIPEDKVKSKKTAIKELVTNLKTQYILFNIRDFIREYQIKSNPYINKQINKTIKILRNICLYIYGISILFERPWFCYESTTIPLPSFYNYVEDCENKVEFMNFPFLYNDVLRVLEIMQTIIITVTQIMKYKDEYILRKTNVGANKYYNRIQIILFISLFLCLADLIFALSMGRFPIVNFIVRPFIFIYLVRRLRMNWISILKVIWRTKKAFSVLSLNMITFSVIGYIFFYKKGGFFETFSQSVLELYILLSTCNFPDIMLEAMEFSKFAIIYFVIYLSINYFILLSFLKTLYTIKYYEVNKQDCLDIIKNIIENKYNKHIYYGKNFSSFLMTQKKLYSLSDDEYNNFLILFNLYDKHSDDFAELIKLIETTPEMNMISKSIYGKYILQSKKVEMVINLICIISTATLFSRHIFFLIFRFLISFSLLHEPIILIKYLGLKRLFARHFNRVIFHVFNIIIILLSIYILTLDKDKEQEKFAFIFQLLRIFISLRTIRIFVFLDKFKIIKNIYIIIRVSKEMLYRNLLLLYSFFLLFSTLSILLTGGNIKKNSFDDEGDFIPDGYVYINFNDFGSSFIACFCLMMINNLNILVKSLTFQSRHKMFFQFYFATFYFFATLILINIMQTLLLEMYLVSDHSLSDKDKNEKNEMIIKENEDEESGDNYHSISNDKEE